MKYCPNDGTKFQDEINFCTKCGSKLEVCIDMENSIDDTPKPVQKPESSTKPEHPAVSSDTDHSISNDNPTTSVDEFVVPKIFTWKRVILSAIIVYLFDKLIIPACVINIDNDFFGPTIVPILFILIFSGCFYMDCFRRIRSYNKGKLSEKKVIGLKKNLKTLAKIKVPALTVFSLVFLPFYLYFGIARYFNCNVENDYAVYRNGFLDYGKRYGIFDQTGATILSGKRKIVIKGDKAYVQRDIDKDTNNYGVINLSSQKWLIPEGKSLKNIDWEIFKQGEFYGLRIKDGDILIESNYTEIEYDSDSHLFIASQGENNTHLYDMSTSLILDQRGMYYEEYYDNTKYFCFYDKKNNETEVFYDRGEEKGYYRIDRCFSCDGKIREIGYIHGSSYFVSAVGNDGKRIIASNKFSKTVDYVWSYSTRREAFDVKIGNHEYWIDADGYKEDY